MGEVYRATDTKLKRQVAIKILPPSLAADDDRLMRFQREAEVLASLNHPHIAGIYGLEETDGSQALIMELVEGEDLSAVIARGAMSFTDALAIAKQIAEALEAAHEQGIIHRDLKPANIKVCADGTVKVLDFGLAKVLAPAAVSGADSTALPTVTSPEMTRMGVILGTAAYMSPEQAKGRAADKRSDIWAFGCILYEMASGKRAFDGATTVEALSAVLEREPDWARLPASVPPALRGLIGRCLRKDPTRRPQHVGDIRIEIEDVLSAPVDTSARTQVRWRPIALAALAVALLVVLTLARTLWTRRTAADVARSDPMRTSIAVPGDVRLTVGGMSVLAISPDGTTLVFSAGHKGRRQLYIRKLKEFAVRPIPDTDDGGGPFFSPDGQWIGFFARGQMKKVAITGGGAVTIAPAPSGRGATWHDDGTIIFTPEPDAGLSRVSAAGGPVQTLTSPNAGANEIAHRWPKILPGAKAVLFTVFKGVEADSLINVLSLETGERKQLISGGTNPIYVPDHATAERGHIVYAREGEVFACPFDLRRLEITGVPRRIENGVKYSSTGSTAFAVSSDGTLVYLSGSASDERILVWVDRRGAEQPLGPPAARVSFPRLSPDGNHLLVTKLEGGNYDLWIYELSSAHWTRLTFDAAFDAAGVWSPDGRRVAFRSFRGQPFNVFWKPSDLSTTEQRITSTHANQIVCGWTGGGRAVIYSEINPAGGTDLWVAAVEGDRTPHSVLRGLVPPAVGVPSPDDRWLAYTSSESGVPEVFVTEFDGNGVPASGTRAQISSGGGVEPSWSRDGRELFYRGSERMMAVPVADGRSLKTAEPQPLFADGYVRFGDLVNYTVASDGRFLMVKQLDETPVEIKIVSNAMQQ
jgi:serine/threonine-protein kinase